MQALLTLAAIGVFAAAAVTDGTSRRIPNMLPATLALLGLARIAAALWVGGPAVAAAADVGTAAAVFVAGALAFRFRLLGGGDAKLLAAGTLWLGAGAFGTFLVLTVLAGGALALGFLAIRLVRQSPVTLPYGIAIAAGGILVSAGTLTA